MISETKKIKYFFFSNILSSKLFFKKLPLYSMLESPYTNDLLMFDFSFISVCCVDMAIHVRYMYIVVRSVALGFLKSTYRKTVPSQGRKLLWRFIKDYINKDQRETRFWFHGFLTVYDMK